MKKAIISISMVLLTSAILITTGCKKEDSIVPTTITEEETDTTKSSLDPTATLYKLPSTVDVALNAKREASKQSFSINAALKNTIVGTKGTKITFEENAFKTSSGASVSGSVTIDLIEVLKYNDMVKLNVSTVGDDNGTPTMLVSGGQIKLTATQNGEALSLNSGKATVKIPSETSDSNMQLFLGSEDSNQNVTWTAPDTTPVTPTPSAQDLIVLSSDTTTIITGTSTYTPSFYYSFPMNSFGWINCDYFYGSLAEKTDVNLSLPAVCDHTNTTAWLIFPSLNSVLGVSKSVGFNGTTFYAPNIEIGLETKLVVLKKENDEYQYVSKDFTIKKDVDETITTLSPTTSEEFDLFIDNL